MFLESANKPAEPNRAPFENGRQFPIGELPDDLGVHASNGPGVSTGY